LAFPAWSASRRKTFPLAVVFLLLPRREYGIDVEVVWHIYRPVMSKLLDAAAPQPAEEGELEEGEEGAVAAGAALEDLAVITTVPTI
jgi:hypothetical protein